jgi:transposase
MRNGSACGCSCPLIRCGAGRWADHRTVINGIFFRARVGCPWRDLPEGFGNWKTIYNRHRRWSLDGNTVERCFSKLKQFRAVATRYDKRERIYQGTIDVASISIWLRDPVP